MTVEFILPAPDIFVVFCSFDGEDLQVIFFSGFCGYVIPDKNHPNLLCLACASQLLKLASFSATNRTVLPCPNAAAIRLVIVCDFPVPGGPSITRLLPFIASIRALCWELSASSIRGKSSLTSSILSISYSSWNSPASSFSEFVEKLFYNVVIADVALPIWPPFWVKVQIHQHF